MLLTIEVLSLAIVARRQLESEKLAPSSPGERPAQLSLSREDDL